jgi:hypothetical protein
MHTMIPVPIHHSIYFNGTVDRGDIPTYGTTIAITQPEPTVEGDGATMFPRPSRFIEIVLGELQLALTILPVPS